VPFDQINAVVVVMQVDAKRLADFRKKAGFCVLEPGDAFDTYVENNKGFQIKTFPNHPAV
jgi:hypothetical protein